MFQFIRRVSASFLPRPDRPWDDDATSHAPTIGRKRRYSVTEHDASDSPSTTKRTKSEPDTEPNSLEDPHVDAVPPVEGQGVKDAKEVELDASSIRPEDIPLPDSPSGSPEPASAESEPATVDVDEETKRQEHADDEDSVASSAPEDDAEGETDDEAGAEEEAITTDTVPKIIPVTTTETGSEDSPEPLEIKT